MIAGGDAVDVDEDVRAAAAAADRHVASYKRVECAWFRRQRISQIDKRDLELV
jgi:hypothetical protein